MIISMTPLRIPLGGGGTDLPSFYQKEDGFWISATINKFIYVAVKSRFEPTIRVAYSALEYADTPNQLEHPIIRTVLNEYKISSHIEIASFADLPSRIGLGSSGAFTVGLLNSLMEYKLSFKNRAEEAFHIEHDLLKRNVGKQDHYSAVYGGIKKYKISSSGEVSFEDLPFKISSFQKWLSLFYISQRPTDIQTEPQTNIFPYLQLIKQIGIKSSEALLNNDFQHYGELMDEHWKVKIKFSPNSKNFNYLIEQTKLHGAISGKLLGAGGAGCLLFVHPPEEKYKIQTFLESQKLIHIPFSFHHKGSELIKI